jgi:hypothetical protein
VFGLLGPNGAGKSTTIGMLTTTIVPTGGAARVGGFDVTREPLAARRISSVVFQDSVVDRALSGQRNLDIHARLWGVPPVEASGQWPEGSSRQVCSRSAWRVERTRHLQGHGQRRRGRRSTGDLPAAIGKPVQSRSHDGPVRRYGQECEHRYHDVRGHRKAVRMALDGSAGVARTCPKRYPCIFSAPRSRADQEGERGGEAAEAETRLATRIPRSEAEEEGFEPGISGNPGGRPKGLSRATRELIGADGLPLVELWWSIAQDPMQRTRLTGRPSTRRDVAVDRLHPALPSDLCGSAFVTDPTAQIALVGGVEPDRDQYGAVSRRRLH